MSIGLLTLCIEPHCRGRAVWCWSPLRVQDVLSSLLAVMTWSPVFIVIQMYSFMVGVPSAWFTPSVCILVAGDLQSFPQTCPPRSSMFYRRNKMQTQGRVPCIVSNAGDAQCTVRNAQGCTELLCVDLRPAGCPLLWKYYACVTVHGETWGVGGRVGTRYFGQGLTTFLPAQPWALLSPAFSCPVYLGAAVGLGMQTGTSGNLQPLWVQPTQALSTGLHGWMISALNNRTALSRHLITRTKQCVIIDIAE